MRRRTVLRALAAGAAGLAVGGAPARARAADVSVDFDRALPGDVWLDSADAALLESTFARLRRVERTVGHGNFHTLGFDQMLRYARSYKSIGVFTRAELDFIDRLFHVDLFAWLDWRQAPVLPTVRPSTRARRIC